MGELTYQMYLKADGVKGDVNQPATYAGWISGSYLSWPGPSQVVRVSPGNAKDPLPGFPDLPDKNNRGRDIVVRVASGSHSPQLIQLQLNRRPIKLVEIRILVAGKTFKALLQDVLLQSYQVNPNGVASVSATETLTFTPAKATLRPA